jgi:outer membrane protein OmpA-like peptidoglycan-associated protein
MRRSAERPAWRQAAGRAWWFSTAVALVLAVLPPRVAVAQTAPTPSISAQELQAALTESKRRLEQQGQTMSGPTLDEAIEGLEAVRGRIESLVPTMTELWTERGELRAQLRQARDELQRCQQQIAALEEKHRNAATEAEMGRAEIGALKQQLTTAEREVAELRSVAASSVEEIRSLGQQLLAALTEQERLVAASAELNSIMSLDGQHLTVRERDEQVRTREPAPGAAGDSWRRTVLEAGIFVAPDSDQPATRASAALGATAQLIRGSTGRVRIVGHLDPSGDVGATRRLSLRRAQAVRDYLVSTYGFDRMRFTVEGKGSDEPAASNDTLSGRRANRRIELFVAG